MTADIDRLLDLTRAREYISQAMKGVLLTRGALDNLGDFQGIRADLMRAAEIINAADEKINEAWRETGKEARE